MAEQTHYPDHRKFKMSAKVRAFVGKKGLLRFGIGPWIAGAMGILAAAFGLILFKSYSLLSQVLISLAVIILGGLLTILFLQVRRDSGKRSFLPRGNVAGGLEAYFFDTGGMLESLKEFVATPTLIKCVLIIQGGGGTGKTMLLKMLSLDCQRKDIPVALSSGSEAKSGIVDILSDWAKDLTRTGIELPTFTQTLNEYFAILKKVKEAGADAERSIHEETTKAAFKTAVQIASSVVGGIPVVGFPLSAVLGGASDTIADFLHSLLSKSQLDLLRDPSEKLTNSFLLDLAHRANTVQQTQTHQRIILFLDAFEQMMEFNRWVCNLAQQLPSNVLLMIAGRVDPNWSDDQWPGWRLQVEFKELRKMTDEEVRILAVNYAEQRGGKLTHTQLEGIVRLAHGLQLVVTMAVEGYLRGGKDKDFPSLETAVVANVVAWLMKDVAEEMRPVLEAAATVRYFNKDILDSIIAGSTPQTVYRDLLQFSSFVQPYKEGFTLHEEVRDFLDEYLRMHERRRYREMHQHAAAYFKTELEEAEGGDSGKYALEWLYHTMCVDEKEGIKHFKSMAEEFVPFQLLDRLRTLLNDVDNYTLQEENSRFWFKYYRARLSDLEGRLTDAVSVYQEIADNEQAEPKLRAYALIDWAWIIRLTDLEKVAQALERVQKLFPEVSSAPSGADPKLGFHLLELGDIYRKQGRWDDALSYLNQAEEFYSRMSDTYWRVFTYNNKKCYYLDRGMWLEALKIQQQQLKELEKLAENSYLKAESLGTLSVGWMWVGWYRKTEENLREALRIAQQFERVQQEIYFMRDLGLILGLQGKLQESEQYFIDGIKLAQQEDPWYEDVARGFQGIIALKWIGVEQAEQYLTSSVDRLRQGNKMWYGLPFLYFSGSLCEVKREHTDISLLELAEKCYQECLEQQHLEQWYWYGWALTGLVRINYAKGNYAAINPLLLQAEELAQRYEYNDQLASLRLIQGHVAWEQGIDAVLPFYKDALIYALRYNRFFLDEILSGCPYGTPFQPIVPYCLTHDGEGQRLLRTIREWWQEGTNDIGIPRTTSISPIPEGIPLLEGEQIAREQEPGEGTQQHWLTEQLDMALAIQWG